MVQEVKKIDDREIPKISDTRFETQKMQDSENNEKMKKKIG